MAHITVFGPEPAAIGRERTLGEERLSIGRDPGSGLVLDHHEVSRRHAAICPGPSGWEIHDLGSSNGIRVQGHRMEAALLTDGDEIRVGPFRIVFSGDLPGTPAATAPRPAPPPPPVPASRTPPASASKRRTGALGAALLALAFVPATIAGYVLLSGPARPAGGLAPPAAGPVGQTPAALLMPEEPLPPAAAWPPAPDPAVRAEVDRAAASLEHALGAGKIEEAFVHVHPAATADLRAAFEPHRAELARVARLLATRRLVVAEEAWAEYEVTEEGRTFAVVFEKVEGRWLLSSL